MTVWRVEDWSGVGPYDGRRSYMNQAGLPTYGDSSHPMPWQDPGLGGWTSGYSFGFSSKEQLRAWFPAKWLLALGRLGLTVTQYRVKRKHVLLGRRQVAFVRKHAVRVSNASNTLNVRRVDVL